MFIKASAILPFLAFNGFLTLIRGEEDYSPRLQENSISLVENGEKSKSLSVASPSDKIRILTEQCEDSSSELKINNKPVTCPDIANYSNHKKLLTCIKMTKVDGVRQKINSICRKTCNNCTEMPTQAPTPSEFPSLTPSKSPSKMPSSAPSKTLSLSPSKVPSKAPSKPPTGSPTATPTYSECKDTAGYEKDTFSCSDISQFHAKKKHRFCDKNSGVTGEHGKKVSHFCPKTCAICTYKPTAAPTDSPTVECEDSAEFTEQVKNGQMELTCSILSTMRNQAKMFWCFKKFQKSDKTVDVWRECPLACGICTAMPTSKPSSLPSSSPSLNPSTSFNPSRSPSTSSPTAYPTVNCVDDTDFRFNKNNDNSMSCVKINEKNESKKLYWCGKSKRHDGNWQKVKFICPKACGLCA